MINRFLTYLKTQGKAEVTIKNYRFDLETFQRLIRKPLEQATIKDVDHFLLDAGGALASRKKKQMTLRSFYKWAVKRDLVRKNPMDLSDPIRLPDYAPRPMRMEDLEAVLVTVKKERDRLLIMLLLESGLRASEALSLRVEDFDFTAGQESFRVKVKGGHTKELPILPGVRFLPLLKGFLAESDIQKGYIFLAYCTKRPLGYRCALKVWQRYLKKAGLTQSGLHRLRHTFATNLLNKGVKITSVSHLLNHKSVLSTQRYAQATNELIRVEMEGLK